MACPVTRNKSIPHPGDSLFTDHRHEEHTAMSPRWVAANRLFISPTSLKYNMAFPGENQFSAVDPITGAPLTMHRHLRNSRNRYRILPSSVGFRV